MINWNTVDNPHDQQQQHIHGHNLTNKYDNGTDLSVRGCPTEEGIVGTDAAAGLGSKAPSTSSCSTPSEELKEILDKDVDRGWAYAVLIASFLAYFISGGLSYSTGIYYVAMLNQFGQSHSYTAWIVSLFYSFFYLGGIVSSRFTERYGCRAGMFVGATLITFGSIAAAFATSFIQVLIIYGVIIGVGHNFIYINIIIVLSRNFRKYHALATSTSMMGSGIGLFCLSLLLESVVEKYGWQISFIFSAGVAAQFYICGAVYFPLKKTRKQLPNATKSNYRIKNNGDHSNCNLVNDLQIKKYGEDETVQFSSFDDGKVKSPIIDEDSTYEAINEMFINNGPDKVKMTKESSSPFKSSQACTSITNKELALLKDVRIWMVCLTVFILHLATPTYFIIFKDFLTEIELNSMSAMGLSIIGAGDVVGRLLTGILASSEHVNILVLYAVSMVCMAIIFIIHLYVRDALFMCTLAATFGLVYGMQNVSLAIVPVKIFGREALPLAFGYITFSIGLSCLIGPPLMGAVMDMTSSYRLGLLILSGDCIVSSLLMLGIYFHSKQPDRK